MSTIILDHMVWPMYFTEIMAQMLFQQVSPDFAKTLSASQ